MVLDVVLPARKAPRCVASMAPGPPPLIMSRPRSVSVLATSTMRRRTRPTCLIEVLRDTHVETAADARRIGGIERLEQFVGRVDRAFGLK